MNELLNRKIIDKIKNAFLKHKNITLFMLIGLLLASVTIYVSFAYFQTIDTTPLIGGKVGNIADIDIRIFVQNKNDSGEGIEGRYSKADSVPLEGYFLNKTKSYCTNGSSIINISKKVKIGSKQPDLCYAYYDVKETDLKIVTTYNGTAGVPPVVGSIANISCTNTGAAYNKKYNRVEVTSISNKNARCDLIYTSKDESSKDYLNYHIVNLINQNQGSGKVVGEISVDQNFGGIKIFEKDEYLNLNNDTSNAWVWNDSEKTWTSSNKSDSTESALTFNPTTNGLYAMCYRQSSEKNYDYATIYKNDSELFNLKGFASDEFVCKSLGDIKSTDIIKVTYKKDGGGSSGNDEVKFYFQSYSYLLQYSTYRYEGKNPNNYVWFNNELWRIIGVFNENVSTGPKDNLVKIIREDFLGSLVWNKESSNNWETSSLKALLNGAYYNKQDGTDSGYCYGNYTDVPSNCDYRINGISDSYRKMVKNVVWHLGGYSSDSVTAEAIYGYERGNNVYYNNPKSTTGYIGLMYPSDYGYSVLASSCVRTTNLGSYDTPKCLGQSWIYKYFYEWTITSYTSGYYQTFNLGRYGDLDYGDAEYGYPVRPVLYLDSLVYVVDGDGSMLNPYIIGM